LRTSPQQICSCNCSSFFLIKLF
jgi:hypothetical protein